MHFEPDFELTPTRLPDPDPTIHKRPNRRPRTFLTRQTTRKTPWSNGLKMMSGNSAAPIVHSERSWITMNGTLAKWKRSRRKKREKWMSFSTPSWKLVPCDSYTMRYCRMHAQLVLCILQLDDMFSKPPHSSKQSGLLRPMRVSSSACCTASGLATIVGKRLQTRQDLSTCLWVKAIAGS